MELTVAELAKMPLLATTSDDWNSPVLGVYKSLALLVFSVVAEPLVAEANNGYTAVAVLVSLEIVAPAAAHEVFVPSVVRYLPDCEVWLGARALKAVLAVVCPVPPLAIAKVPASVTAPVVPVDGVSPVVPALNEVTPVLLMVSVPEPVVVLMPVPEPSVATE